MAKKKKSTKNKSVKKKVAKRLPRLVMETPPESLEDLPGIQEPEVEIQPVVLQEPVPVQAVQKAGSDPYPPVVEAMQEIGYKLRGRNKAGEIFMVMLGGKNEDDAWYRVTRNEEELEFVGNGVMDDLII